MVPNDLTHFRPEEFSYPALMDVAFVRWLDRVRDLAGVPMTITNAGRVEGDPNPTGSAGKHSLHMRGRAVDLRSRDWNARQKWQIISAVVALANECPGKVELEMVYSDTDRHLHLAANDLPGAEHVLIESDE